LKFEDENHFESLTGTPASYRVRELSEDLSVCLRELAGIGSRLNGNGRSRERTRSVRNEGGVRKWSRDSSQDKTSPFLGIEQEKKR